jgi:hypothetical protein
MSTLIRAELLSRDLSITKIWVGRGTGKMCISCNRPISPDVIEYQLDLPGPASGKPITLWFDQRCLAGWREERTRLDVA